MLMGTFTPIHFLSLAVGAALLVGLYFALKKASQKTQTWVLFALSLLGYASIIYNLWVEDIKWYFLPLHLCSLNALVLPFAVASRNKVLGNLLLLWSLGALVALVLNYDVAGRPVLSWKVFFYYFPHLVEFGIPVLLFKLGHVKKDPRCIVPILVISLVAYTVVHFINLAVTHYTGYGTNYMFSMFPNNPLVELFYSWVPLQYWYMYLIFPIVVVYLLGVYAPQLLRRKVKAV